MTRNEQRVLAVVGVIGLIGLGVRLLQLRTLPLHIEANVVQAIAPADPAWSGQLASARQIDINQAGVAELEGLPGIGPALAEQIVEDRRSHGSFLHREDLARVPGIGTKRAEALAAYVTTE